MSKEKQQKLIKNWFTVDEKNPSMKTLPYKLYGQRKDYGFRVYRFLKIFEKEHITYSEEPEYQNGAIEIDGQIVSNGVFDDEVLAFYRD